MKKLLIAVVVILLLLALPIVGMIATGAISAHSIPAMANVIFGLGGGTPDEETQRSRYKLAEGFTATVFADQLEGARFMALSAAGDLLVSRPHQSDIVLLRADADGDGRSDTTETLLSELKRPLGIALHDGWLYYAESHQVSRIRFDESAGRISGEPERLIGDMTDDGNHWSKTIGFGPDGRLYLAQGSTCNVCEEADVRRATMMRFKADGSEAETIATGLRNSVGFDWAPWSGRLYATDNGRDLLGDDYPPCELNEIRAGNFYGWPYFNGANKPDPDMGEDPQGAKRTPIAPAHEFRSHNAPLGIHFVQQASWPAHYQRAALVALHGSWNRSEADGYKVVSLHWDASGDNIEERDFFSGFNLNGDIIGRPVDIETGPDGSVFVSDDFAQAIYQVRYSGEPDASAAMRVEQAADSRGSDDWLAEVDQAAYRQAGQALYESNGCAACHEQGENPRLLKGLQDRYNASQVAALLAAPPSPMPVYELSEKQRRSLAVFLLSKD